MTWDTWSSTFLGYQPNLCARVSFASCQKKTEKEKAEMLRAKFPTKNTIHEKVLLIHDCACYLWFGGKLALGVWAFSFSIFFLSSLVQREMSTDTKIWLVTREVTASGILQVSNKSFVAFLLNNSAHRSDIVWSKETLCIFFLFLFLFLFPPIFDWLILFSFEAHS